MRKSEIKLKIQALHNQVAKRLENPRGLYFDPQTVLNLFERYIPLREGLKKLEPDLFGDIPSYEIPKPSQTTDNDGRGYIKRSEIESLSHDIGYCLDLLPDTEPIVQQQMTTSPTELAQSSEGFIIMQIGNPDLDEVCNDAIVPAIENCGLKAKRVDKHNEGQLLKSEIIQFIQRGDIIVADLTNERPNCYLEVGYTMGVDKFRNLIMTAREDHHKESDNWKKGDPKIHFDLEGYDILFWRPEKLDDFRSELEKRIRRRLAIVRPSSPLQPLPIWDEEWFEDHRKQALQGLKGSQYSGFMEIMFTLEGNKINNKQSELAQAAQQAVIHTFGWPIAVFLGNRDEYRPHPTTDGIKTEMPLGETYDYWVLRKNGDFYLLANLFEDKRKRERSLFPNTRIVRVAETLLYCARLYSRLDVPPDTIVRIRLSHGGLEGRELSATGSRDIDEGYVSKEDQSAKEITIKLSEIEGKLVDLVEEICSDLFVLFAYFQLDRATYEKIVNAFVAGKIL